MVYEHELSIDIETRSGTDLLKSGVFRYVQDLHFQILLFAYSLDNGPVVCIDLYKGQQIPTEVFAMLTDPKVLKTAHNAQFEITCISKAFRIPLDVSQWDCTLIRSGSLSLPLALAAVGKALRLPEQKDFTGKALIRLFCVPDKKTGLFNCPEDYPAEWEAFKRYCAKDVTVERSIRERITKLENITETERRMYCLDQKINRRGIAVDQALINNAIRFDEAYRLTRISEAKELTGLDNPASVKQLIEWLNVEFETEEERIETLRKADIPPLLKKSPSPIVTRVLEIRQELSKTSVSKFKAMINCVCSDGRIRGLLQMYGASRTGRFAGRLVQAHNLPKNDMKLLDAAREILLSGDAGWIELIFGAIPATLSQLIRTAFVAKPGHRLIVSDFTAIEAVVIAWLANEKWRLDVFRTHGKIYEASASKMFCIPMESITKDSQERADGKIAELALGFGGSENAIAKMDKDNRIPAKERLPLVYRWREANPNIVQLWRTVNDAVLRVLKTGQRENLMKGIKITLERGALFIHLPSGRKLTYIRPRIVENRFGGESMAYEGQNQTTNKWELQETYGGKLVENIVQAIARDLLVEAMLRIDAAGYNIVLHVHDEVVTEMPIGTGSVEELNAIMAMPVWWAEGMPLKAAGFENLYYKKD